MLSSRCTSLLLRSKPEQQNWLCFFKKFKKQCALLGLMKLKLLRGTLFLTIIMDQKVRKNKKMTKGPSLEIARGLLICLLTLRLRMPHICGFLDCFSFSHFLNTSCCFQNLRLSSLNFELNLGKTSQIFAIQMYQFAAVQQTSTANLAAYFQKILKTTRALRVKRKLFFIRFV